LAVSPSGQFLASGQLGTRSYKGAAAPIFIWNVETGHRLVALRGKVITQLTLFKIVIISIRSNPESEFIGVFH
jgi:hypothetical protein